MVFKELERLKEKIPSTDPLDRLLCDSSKNCEIIQTPYDIIIKVTGDQICLYEVSEVTVSTRQREKITLPGGIELDQEASYKLIPKGCFKLPENISTKELRENPSKLLKMLSQLQEQKNNCHCSFISRDSKFNDISKLLSYRYEDQEI